MRIAKWPGARVTAVTRAANIALLRSVDADEVIDRDTRDFTHGSERYDVVFDVGGNRPSHLRRVVARTGTIVAVGAPPGRWRAPATRMLKAAVLSPFVGERRVPFISCNNRASLGLLADLAEAGRIRPAVDRQFALSETAKAIWYVGAGRARGKVIKVR